MTAAKTTWTNATIRRHLGERGYLEDREPVFSNTSEVLTLWTRGNDRVFLSEFRDNRAPILRAYHNGRRVQIDPNNLGMRNPNIQNDGSRDE